MAQSRQAQPIGIILNGVTGRMGTHQHLYRSLAPIIRQGGLDFRGSTLLPRLLLVGRNEEKLRQVAAGANLAPDDIHISTHLAAALADPAYTIYFDAQTTDRRVESVREAIAAGKHIYCEKPTATTTAAALALARLAQGAGVKHGVVQDKLWLPGIQKLATLIRSNFLGQILSVRGEFGYYVFPGDNPAQPPQRPSWNYRAEQGGGIILDMLCHWRYLLDNLFGPVRSLTCLGKTHIGQRFDEQKQPYTPTADDAAYATFELSNGIICHFNSSWCTRVRRDDLLTLQVDGTEGSAVATLRDCLIQPAAATPRPVWNPDIPNPIDFFDTWQPATKTDDSTYDNAFKTQWELFLKHVAFNEPFPWTLFEGAKGVQLAELGLRSWRERKWIDVPAL